MVAGHSHIVTPATLTFSDQIASGIYLFGFKRSFEFEAGQVIGVALREDGARRLYSICSGEQDKEIRILYNVIEEGYLTPRLSGLDTGDTIWVTQPRGEFICNDEFHAVFGSNYIRCCSAETAEGVFAGRVTDFLRKQPSSDPGLMYYLCGNAEMVVETRDILIEKGIPFDQIISEIYF